MQLVNMYLNLHKNILIIAKNWSIKPKKGGVMNGEKRTSDLL